MCCRCQLHLVNISVCLYVCIHNVFPLLAALDNVYIDIDLCYYNLIYRKLTLLFA